MARSTGEEYLDALRALVDARARIDRELQATQAVDVDGVSAPQSQVRNALNTVGEAGQLRPVRPTQEQGDSAQLLALTRRRRALLDSAAAGVADASRSLLESRDRDAHQQEVVADLTWRVTLPVLAGLVVMLALSGTMPAALAAAIGGVFAGGVVTVLKAYVYRALQPIDGRGGLGPNDAAIVLIGAIVVVFALLGAVISRGAGVVLCLAVAGAAGYLAYGRWALWRRCR